MQNKVSVHPAFLKGAKLSDDDRVIVDRWLSGGCVSDSPSDSLRDHLTDIGIEDPPTLYSILDVAVGRVLHGWDDGEFTVASTDEGAEARDSLPAQALFTINWATSGPGFDWPSSYSLYLIPSDHLYIVVASQDSDSFGYPNIALGRFSTQGALLREVERIIVSDWRRQKDQGDRERWCEFRSAGLVSRKLAEQWADQVWEVNVNDDGDEEMD